MRQLRLDQAVAPEAFEICESGGKATAWELTGKTVGPEFFERHALRELEAWPDHDLKISAA